MEAYKNLLNEWSDWLIAGGDYTVMSTLDKIPGGWEKMRAVCDKETADRIADDGTLPPQQLNNTFSDDEEEGEEDSPYEGPTFATAREREQWTWRSPKFPHPYAMLYLDGVAADLIREYVIATMPEKVAMGLATLANWAPAATAVAPTVNIAPLLGEWRVDGLLEQWVKAHSDANIENNPDQDGNPQWCRKA